MLHKSDDISCDFIWQLIFLLPPRFLCCPRIPSLQGKTLRTAGLRSGSLRSLKIITAGPAVAAGSSGGDLQTFTTSCSSPTTPPMKASPGLKGILATFFQLWGEKKLLINKIHLQLVTSLDLHCITVCYRISASEKNNNMLSIETTVAYL